MASGGSEENTKLNYSQLTRQEKEHILMCSKLAAADKVTPENAFDMNFIDLMPKLVHTPDGALNAPVAENSVGVSAKIYGARVDHLGEIVDKLDEYLRSNGFYDDMLTKKEESHSSPVDDVVVKKEDSGSSVVTVANIKKESATETVRDIESSLHNEFLGVLFNPFFGFDNKMVNKLQGHFIRGNVKAALEPLNWPQSFEVMKAFWKFTCMVARRKKITGHASCDMMKCGNIKCDMNKHILFSELLKSTKDYLQVKPGNLLNYERGAYVLILLALKHKFLVKESDKMDDYYICLNHEIMVEPCNVINIA